ncbi:MAG: hypothetical protein NC092_07000, partial [Butyrivibrio sp.]|nr:hypothetical protein [Butyrivibrio sp.]
RNAEEVFHTSPQNAREVWQEVDRPGKEVDYVFASVATYSPSEEMMQVIVSWSGAGDTEAEAEFESEHEPKLEVAFDEEAAEERDKKFDCTQMIQSLAGERGYEMKGIISAQGGLYYMLELAR